LCAAGRLYDRLTDKGRLWMFTAQHGMFHHNTAAQLGQPSFWF